MATTDITIKPSSNSIGDQMVTQLPSNTKIGPIKSWFASWNGVKKEQIQFFNDGEHLQDDETWEHYDIKGGKYIIEAVIKR